MLSIAKVGTGAAAVSYYETADDYYSHDRSPSHWMGDGAGRLGLIGQVDAQTFRELLDGQLPDGSQIHHAAECRRGGTDFTFSAPKSVSMQALIAGDVRLIEAHEAAVSRALEYAQDLAAYRATEAGVTRAEASCNLLVASFRHDLSRDADPQLHTHAVVINATQRPDGEWRALEQGEFYRQQKLMGALYRAELGLAVQKLGYELRMTHSDGRFELAHFSQQQIDAFSTRSRAIEAALAKEGKTRGEASAREKEIAALTTRNGKGELDRTALREAWRLKSLEIGIDFSPPLQPKIPSMEARGGAARDAVTLALAHVTERQSVVTVPQVVRAALEQGIGSTDRLSIVAEIERQAKAGTLIQVSDRITTPQAQQREREILAVELRGRGAVVPIMDKHRAERTLATTSLNACQRAAAALVVTTDSRISAVQGAAGTGKTTMLAEARRLAEANGYQVVGVAPSAAAARELGKAGIESRTLAAFNGRENPGIDGRSIVILDEAGMVSTRDMRELFSKVEAVGARVILVGDVQQLKAVEAGKPFAQLQAAGVARVEMGEIQRQHDAELRRAVELAAKGEVERSMAVLSRQVVEIENHRDRHLAIARGYATLPAGDRDRTLIVAGTHVARTAINDNVRSELGLVGRGIVVTNLERKDLTRVQARSSLSYQTGDC
jgi:conjugative relaxase-like TrwC/TraI family protein